MIWQRLIATLLANSDPAKLLFYKGRKAFIGNRDRRKRAGLSDRTGKLIARKVKSYTLSAVERAFIGELFVSSLRGVPAFNNYEGGLF